MTLRFGYIGSACADLLALGFVDEAIVLALEQVGRGARVDRVDQAVEQDFASLEGNRNRGRRSGRRRGLDLLESRHRLDHAARRRDERAHRVARKQHDAPLRRDLPLAAHAADRVDKRLHAREVAQRRLVVELLGHCLQLADLEPDVPRLEDGLPLT